MPRIAQGMKKSLIGAVTTIAVCLLGAVPAVAVYGDEPSQPQSGNAATVQSQQPNDGENAGAQNEGQQSSQNAPAHPQNSFTDADNSSNSSNQNNSSVPNAETSQPSQDESQDKAESASTDDTNSKSAKSDSSSGSEGSDSAAQDPIKQMDALALASKDVLADGVYAFASAVGGDHLLEIAGGSTADGGNAQLFRNNRHSTQRWKVTHDAKGYITLTNMRSGKVLDVTGGFSGANAQQYYVSGSAGQRWIAVAGVDGSLVFHSALKTDLVLDVAGGANKNNANVQIYRQNGTKAQRWSVDDSPFADGQIEAYWNGKSALGQPQAPEYTSRDGSYAIQEFTNGTVYEKNGDADATYSVMGNMSKAYADKGGPEGQLGYPIADSRVDGNRAAQHFEHGSLMVTATAGGLEELVINADISAYWRSQGGATGWLGWPTADESQIDGSHSAQSFDGGAVYWYANGDSVPSIQSVWESHEGTSDSLGRSTSNLTIKTAKYYIHTYERGAIFATSKTDAATAVVMDSDIFKYWNGHGGLSSYLGPPTENEQSITTVDGEDAKFQRFKGGVVYTSAETGTHGLRGDIRIGHDVRGGAKGFLGLPTSEQTTTVRGGASQQFQHGGMYWRPGAGAYPVSGEFFQRYTAQGAERGDRGFPTSDEYNDRGHMRQDFEHGSYWAGGMPNGAFSHNVIWNGQPNNFYCAPTSGFMIMHTANRNPAANGTPLTIDAMGQYMHTGLPYGTWEADAVNGMNNWVGTPMFAAHGYPSYETLRSEVLRSYQTGYAPMLYTYERRGGAHPNGHPNASFGHAMVVDTYNTQDDSVLIADPLAVYGGAPKFWDHLAGFRDNYMTWSLDTDPPAIITAR